VALRPASAITSDEQGIPAATGNPS
jgi:hypothetical protein